VDEIGNNAFFSPMQPSCPSLGLHGRAQEVGRFGRRQDQRGGGERAARWGEPLYDKLDADLAHALMGLNAVKGVEIGDGMQAARQLGTEHRDEITPRDS